MLTCADVSMLLSDNSMSVKDFAFTLRHSGFNTFPITDRIRDESSSKRNGAIGASHWNSLRKGSTLEADEMKKASLARSVRSLSAFSTTLKALDAETAVKLRLKEGWFSFSFLRLDRFGILVQIWYHFLSSFCHTYIFNPSHRTKFSWEEIGTANSCVFGSS